MRKLLNLSCVFIVLLLTGCNQQQDTSVIHNWSLQSHAVANSSSFRELQKFAENVALMSEGRLLITPYPAGEHAHGANIFNAVAENRVQMGNGWPNWWSAQHQAWAVMNSGPLDFMNIDASMMFFLEKEGAVFANQLSQESGVLWRPAWWAGMEFGLVSKTPITGLSDLAGKKVRIGPGLPSEVLAKASNSLTIPLVPEEIKPSMIAGNIDAVEWTTTSGLFDLEIVDISPYAIVPAIWQPSVLSDFLINAEAYDALEPALKSILETAIKSFTLTATLKAKVNDIDALKMLKEGGMHFNHWNEADLTKWRSASEEIISQYKKDPFSSQLIEKKHEFKKDFDEYYDLFGPFE
ncbi:hypothetical protein [Methylophaga sp.]|uniref:hypothetical protein n=1 Tax=Methylophaga sp. TaxID=2024840 RepID=UPI003F69752B